MSEQQDMFDKDDGEILVTKEMLDAVKIDDLALDEEFIRFPGDLAYWNAKYAKSLEAYLIAKHEFEVTKARLWIEIKNEELAADNKVTVDDIKCMVMLREEWEEAHLAFIRAEVQKEKMKKFTEAVSSKKDMLQSLGAKLRVELEGDPSIRHQHREARQYG